MRRVKAIFFISIILFQGCSGSFKSRWDNFNAYYNTYYNAKRAFKSGEETVLDQKININPERPIRIYEKPNKIGAAEFKKTIEKGADILRDHPESKWVDDAILLIGKSYFYQTQYFSAEQKFNELAIATENDNLRQQAVIWRGRTLLEMNRLTEAVDYLQKEINTDYGWNSRNLAFARAVLAEVYVLLQEWEAAIVQLQLSAGELRNRTENAKAYFLLGQLLEQENRPLEAGAAFQNVIKTQPDYSILFQGQLKFATIARDNGSYKEALKIFEKMLRDDKNFDIVADLRYEYGRTLQLMGKIEDAQEQYEQLLYRAIKQPTKETRAKTYYAQGEIARDVYMDYNLAAMYFDSSATRGADINKLPEDFDAAELSESFGRYVELRSEIHEMDSLMWLSTLNEDELNAVIEKLVEQKQRELEKLLKEQEEASNTFSTGLQEGSSNENGAGSEEYGFLNFKNPTLVASTQQNFYAIWGRRPLADHWRRSAFLTQNGSEDEDASGEEGVEGEVRTFQVSRESISLDDIPFEAEQKTEMRLKMAEKRYEMGNLFYLSIGIPDSASSYYREIVSDFSETEVVPRTLYTLSELSRLQNDDIEAENWAKILVERYPGTSLASKVATNYGLQIKENTAIESMDRNELQEWEFLQDSMSTKPALSAAYQYQGFADSAEQSIIAQEAYWNAVQKYSEHGASQPIYSQRMRELSLRKEEHLKNSEFILQMKDSAKVILADSMASSADTLQWKSWADTSIAPFQADELFPYQGMAWDSVRSILTKMTGDKGNSIYTDRVKRLLKEVKLPESLQKKAEMECGSDLEELRSSAIKHLSTADLSGIITITIDEKRMITSVSHDGFLTEEQLDVLTKQWVNKVKVAWADEELPKDGKIALKLESKLVESDS